MILDTSNFFTFLSKTKSEYLDRLIVEAIVFNVVFPDMHHFSIWIYQNSKKNPFSLFSNLLFRVLTKRILPISCLLKIKVSKPSQL